MVKKSLQEKINDCDVYVYTISDVIVAEISELGATVTAIKVPSADGSSIDVVAGGVSAEDILGECIYRGSTIGRYSNRIADGKMLLDGKEYKLFQNNGKAHLHGGKEGFNTKVFSSSVGENSVTFTYVSPDGEEGYPSKLTVSVKYTVKGKTLIIEYFGESDGTTVYNPTNHTFFNLNGEDDGSITDIMLKINAEKFLPVNDGLIPTGEERAVKNTPFDFTKYKPIGKDIKSDYEQIRIVNGYDHNFCLNGEHCASAYSQKTGIVMDCYTDMPGVQLYTSNNKTIKKGKSEYGEYSAFCLETQFYPNCVNNSKWKCPILRKGDKFYSKTEYVFSLREKE